MGGGAVHSHGDDDLVKCAVCHVHECVCGGALEHSYGVNICKSES